MKLCIIGAGLFSGCFVPIFRAHPGVSEVSLCKIVSDRLASVANELSTTRRFASFEDVLKSDVDAVAIFTQRHMYAGLALEALRAGKHVYCAVPAATTLEELEELFSTVKSTGLTYMMGEKSEYYGATVFSREKWATGAFGDFVYGEGDYCHDMSRPYGTIGSFEEQTGAAVWTDLHGTVEDVESRVRCGAAPTAAHREMMRVDPALQSEFASDFAEVHQPLRRRLPRSFASCHTGHEGSHQFLVDDFVTAVLEARLPSVHVWKAARYNAPGIVAHASSLKEGEHMRIPDFGWPERSAEGFGT